MDDGLPTQLLTCVEHNDAKKLQEIRYGQTDSLLKFALKEKRKDGITALHLAALKGHTDCLRILIDMHVEVDIRARRAAFRETPLHMAASNGFFACVELLVTHGADINALSITQQTPYSLAVYHQHWECADFLAREKAKQAEREKEILLRQLALFQACYDGNIDEFLALLDANPLFMTCKDEDGYTLLQRACQRGHFGIVDHLLKRGAPATLCHEGSGDNLLHMIARMKKYAAGAALARHLLSLYPEMAGQENTDKALPLHLACESGNLAISSVLLRFQEQNMQLVKLGHCPDLGGPADNGNSFSFEYLAHTVDYWMETDLGGRPSLKEHDIGATLEWKTRHSPSHFSNTPDTADKYLQYNAVEAHALMFPINSSRKSDGNTPFHLAVISNNCHIVKQLLVYGGYEGNESTEPRSPSIDGKYEQEQDGNIADCKLLQSMFSCVKLTVENARGYQPLHEAIVRGYVQMTYLLGAAGEEDLFNSQFTKFKVEHHQLKRSLSLLELAVASKHLDILGLLLVHYDGTEAMGSALQLAGELAFAHGASLLLAKMVHDSCSKFFREQVSRDGIQAGKKEMENIGQITWEQTGLKTLETHYLQLASWVVGRFVKCAEALLTEIVDMPQQPSQQALENIMVTVFQRCCDGALTSFRSALAAPPSLTSNLITILNLSGNHLKTIPMAIFQLPQLKVLILSENELCELPVPTGQSLNFSEDDDMVDFSPESIVSFALTPVDKEYNCRELAQIQLQHNKLTSLPGLLFNLDGLEMLDISHNQLKSLPFEMWTSDRLRSIRANHNCLESLPAHHLRGMTTISEHSGSHGILMASRQMSKQGATQRSAFLEEHQTGTTITGGLRARSANLAEIDSLLPEDIDFSHPLKKLSLVHNKLKTLPPNLCCLAPNLEELDISSNQLTSINLLSLPAHLLVLQANYNKLTLLKTEHIPGNCAWSLLDSANPVQPDGKQSTRQLRCGHVKGYLPNLNTMRLTGNVLSSLELTVGANTIMKEPDLDEEEDDVVPTAMLSANTGTGGSSSGYSSGSAAVTDGEPEGLTLIMPSLTYLYLDHNQFERVPEDVLKCRALNVLFLGHNDIEELPEDLGGLHHLYQLNVDQLQLKNLHATVLERGNKAIITYLRGIKAQSVVHRRMKLMVVGRHGRGKTTLVRALRDGGALRRSKLKTVSTRGVDVQCWCSVTRSTKPFQKAPPPINFCVWDFGGQEEYYATHQCFLSKRALYLAVWNMEDGVKGICELQPWLVNIQARAPGSTVIIVGTHLDKVTSSLSRQQVDDLKAAVRSRYLTQEVNMGMPVHRPGMPNVVAAMEISNIKGSSVKELRDLVYTTASEIRVRLPGRDPRLSPRMVEQLVPESYSVLEEAVRNAAVGLLQDGRIPVLTSADYMETLIKYSSNPEKLPHADEIAAATSFLHDFGILLHYEEPALQDLYFIHPQWLCHTLSEVIAVKEINSFARKGVMKVSDLQHLFDRSKSMPRIFNQCVNLMERFEIALRISDTNLLIPSMLPQRYEEGQRTADFGNCLSGIDDQDEIRFSHSYSGSSLHSTERVSPPSSSHSRYNKLSRETRLRLEDFRQLQLNQNASASCLPPRTDMPSTIDDCEFLPGEDFSRLYITPYPPTGFWPRLISRMLADKMMAAKLKESLPAKLAAGVVSGMDLIDWVCWRTGIELHLASCAVMRVSRLNDTMTSAANCNANLYCAENWHSLGQIGHCGVEVFVNVHAVREVMDILHDDPMSTMNSCSKKPRLSTKASRTGNLRPTESLRYYRRKPLLTSVSTQDDTSSLLLERRARLKGQDAQSFESMPSQSTSSNAGTPRNFENVEESDPLESIRDFQQLASNAAEALNVAHLKKDPADTPMQRGSRLAVWLLARVVSHIDSLLFDWYGGLHSNEGYSTMNNNRPSVIRVVPCPRCMVEVRKRMSVTSDASEMEGDQMPEAVFDMATGLAEKIFEAATSPGQGSRPHTRLSQPVRLQSDADEDDDYSIDFADSPLSCFSLCDIAVRANSDIPVGQCQIDCSRHGGLSVLRLAPDMFFADVPKEKEFTSADYVQCTSLDKGGFGEVYNGRLFKTKSGHPHPVAIKIFELPKDHAEVGRGAQLRQALKLYMNARAEIGILATLKHGNIVELLGVNRKPLRMLMARAPCGNLKNWLAKYRAKNIQLPQHVLHPCLSQIAAALEYLHSNQIIYRDLKPANTLVWSFPSPLGASSEECSESVPVQLRLADYGISQFCSPSGIKGLKDGTRVYMAPEVVQFGGKETFNEKVDVYAYGANMYELLTLNPPYANESMLAVAEKIRNGFLPPLPKKCRRRFLQVRTLMRWCIRKEPHERPSFKQICSALASHSFLRLIDKVRITDSSTVTAGIGQMPSVPIVGQIPSNTSVSFPRPSTTVDGDWVVFESRDQPACPVEAAGEVHSRSALPTAEGDSSAPAAIVAAARTATAAVRSNAAVTSVNDVQCEGSLSTVWLGDGDGCVSVVDYRRGRTSKPPFVKICQSHITGLLSIDSRVWIASEHDGVFLYDCCLQQCLGQWTGQGLTDPVSKLEEVRKVAPVPVEAVSPGAEVQPVALMPHSDTGDAVPGTDSPQLGRRGRFRTVCILAIQSLGFVLVAHTNGSLAVFSSSQPDGGVNKMEPLKNHRRTKDREVCCMALVRPSAEKEEIWMGLRSSKVLVVSVSQLLSDELLENIDSSRIIDVINECPEYKESRRIRQLTTMSATMATAGVTASCTPNTLSTESAAMELPRDAMIDQGVWLAVDKMSIASCWSTGTRKLMKPCGILDCQNDAIIPRLPGMSAHQYANETRVTALLPLSDKVVVGTGGGHIIVAALDTLEPLFVLAAYRGPVRCLLPYTFPITGRRRARSLRRESAGYFSVRHSSAPANDLEGRELVLSCGQGSRGLKTGTTFDDSIKASHFGASELITEGYLMMWLVD